MEMRWIIRDLCFIDKTDKITVKGWLQFWSLGVC